MNNLPHYQLYLMDADGTLLDFDAAERQALKTTLARLGIPNNSQTLACYRRINDGLWQKLSEGKITRQALFDRRFSLFADQMGIQLNSPAVNKLFLNNLGQQAQLIPGALETVRALSARAVVAVITNGATLAQKERFRLSGLAPYISYYVISEEVGMEKPSPAIFEHALMLCGHQDKSTALMVGDEPRSDIAGARATGIASCLFDPRGIHPKGTADYHIRALEELL